MGNAISACFSKYATFSGRATRSEYWYFVLFYALIYIFCAFLTFADSTLSSIFLIAIVAGFFLPLLSCAVRRAHDAGRSGWFLLIPYVNLEILCTASTGDNRFGPAA
jgi:uncharacterized membrane protein YhaH (DUF805 family)